MSLIKYSFVTVFCYGMVYSLPALFTGSDGGILATTISYIIGAVLLLFFYQKTVGRIAFDHSSSPWLIVGWGMAGIFLALVVQEVSLQISTLLNAAAISENTTNTLMIIRQKPFFAITAMLLGPIMEELVFRRGILGFFKYYTNGIVATLISSLVFALAHADNQLIVYFLLGCCFSWIYAKSGNIWSPIIAHAGMNTVVVLIQLLLFNSVV